MTVVPIAETLQGFFMLSQVSRAFFRAARSEKPLGMSTECS
jgi:hypothetical protein|tara:strand:- start:101 stop:223 length:123 start_codon:yes stop_codon:yes gene_type:complete